MIEHHITDSATQLLSDINDNLDELGMASVSDSSASSLCSQLNDRFSDIECTTLSANMSGPDFIDALNYNFELADEEEEWVKSSVSLFHISDTHNQRGSLMYASSHLADVDHIVHTGDTVYASVHTDNITGESVEDKAERLRKTLWILGNHDAADTYAKNAENARLAVADVLANSGITFGKTFPLESDDPKDYGTYWHKDITISTKSKLRIIAIDQYNYWNYPNNGGYTLDTGGALYSNVYSQYQVNWLINLLKGLSKKDYFIILCHECPVSNANMAFQRLRRLNEFCGTTIWSNSASNGYVWSGNYKDKGSDTVKSYPTSSSYDFLPVIVDAYLHERKLRLTGSSTYNRSHVYINGTNSADDSNGYCDFSGNGAAKFMGYLCGHVHRSWIEYHPIFNDQLIMMVDAAAYTQGGDTANDGETNQENSMRMNKVTLDFENKKITIERTNGMRCNSKEYTARNYVQASGECVSYDHDQYDIHLTPTPKSRLSSASELPTTAGQYDGPYIIGESGSGFISEEDTPGVGFLYTWVGTGGNAVDGKYNRIEAVPEYTYQEKRMRPVRFNLKRTSINDHGEIYDNGSWSPVVLDPSQSDYYTNFIFT